MGFLDDIKKGADNLSGSINSSVQGTQTKGRVNDLLHDLGVLSWATRTGQAVPDAGAQQARIEAELAEIATAAPLDLSLKTAPPPPPGAVTPPPPPGAVTRRRRRARRRARRLRLRVR